MNTQNTVAVLAIAAMVLISHSEASAQSSQYKRPSKKTSTAELNPPVPVTANPADKKTDSGATSSDKVDISDLEQKYWAPKDTEFSVVQNRLYSKEGRFALTPQVGPLLNDSFSTGLVYGLSLNYYFTEKTGVELHYTHYDLQNSKVYEGFYNNNGVSPDFNRQARYIGASFNWIPIYGKMSLLDKKILYFDMSFSPGIGMMTYDQQTASGNGDTLNSFALSLDVAQHFFINKNFALRLDMRNKFYNDQVVKFRTKQPVSEKNNHNVTVMFGITYYH